MIEISRAEEWPLKLYPEVETPTKDVLSHYALIIEHDGGYIIHHTITWCMWFLSPEEYEHIFEIEEFRRLHIILDESIDEDAVAEQTYLKRSEISKPYKFDKFSHYVIMTTSACNARCPYCYEKGIAKITMNEKTAEDTYQFIKRTNVGSVEIRWFGGEPLLNTKVIDYICRRMDEEGINYKSTIITNGYFLEDYYDKFDKWHLHQFQVSIDNINDKYDEIKQYVDKSESPFEKVIRGIKKVCLNDDNVINIRINVSDKNIDDLNDIIVCLKERLSDEISRGRLSFRPATIYEITCESTGEKPKEFDKRMEEIKMGHKDIFPNAGKPSILRKSSLYFCTACAGWGIVINPIGKISPCEHWKDEDIVGDVVNGLTDAKVAEEWRIKSGKNIEFCKKMRCPILPTCNHFYKCDACPLCKTERKFELSMENRKNGIIATYEYYKEKTTQ